MSSRNARLSCRSKLEKVNYVFEHLDPKHQRLFKESCFGGLLNLRTNHVGMQLIHQIIVREVDTRKRHEAWFEFSGKRARFGLQEFTLVTGLNAGELGDESMKPGQRCMLLEKYFKKCRGKPNRKDLLVAFDECPNQSHKFKLGLLVCLVWVLLGAEERNILDPWWFVIVEDVAKFNSYPWGKKSFLCTLRNFRCLSAKINPKQRSREHYNLQGFPFAVMIWALEAIPAIREKFATCTGEKVPRMLKWDIDESFRVKQLESVFGLGNLMVNSTLEPTVGEKVAAFFVEMTCLVEVDDPKVCGTHRDDDCDSKDNYVDEIPEDCEEPLQNCTANSNDHIVRSLMRVIDEKFEECKRAIVAVVDTRLGCVEAKLDELSRTVKLLRTRENSVVEEAGDRETTDIRTGAAEEHNFDANDEHILEHESSEDDGGGNSSDGFQQNRRLRAVMDSGLLNGRKLRSDIGVGNSISGSACKRLAVVMDSGRSKLRKLDSVDFYNPYRVVDESKVDKLSRWLLNAGPRDVVELPICEVSRKFFDDLLNNKWLTDQHVDVGLYHIRKMVGEHVELFDQSPCILDSIFTQFVNIVHVELKKKFGGRRKPSNSVVESWMKSNRCVSRALRNYVVGVNPMLGKPWTSSGILYIPCCICDHWIALRVDLKERLIEVYDSAPKHIKPAVLKLSLSPLSCVIPWLVRIFIDESYGTEEFTVLRSRDVCPNQENGVDCGVMVLKFIVFLLAGIKLTLVRLDMTFSWRKKLAAEIFSQHFDP